MVSVAELARALAADFFGDGAIKVAGAAEPETAGADQIALAMSPAFAEGLKSGDRKSVV